jgi:ABC-type branched-subunit amino acid transport system substrate-binding protein
MVLGVSAAASVALLAQPLSQALGAAGGIISGLGGQLRLHPRMFAVAGVLVIWSSSLGVYANTIGRNALGVGGAVASGGSSPEDNGAAGTSSPDASPSSGPTAPGAAGGSTSRAGSAGNAQALTGAAAYLNNTNAPRPPAADLFGPGDNTVGITNTTIQLCAHAALTFGPAFNIGASDLNVFWQMINAQGGVWGRKLVQPNGSDGITFQDDGYQPSKAVTAAQACQDQSGGDFFLLGGIGFDQIPAVRVWAEQHHMPYIHHIATANGSQGLRYSYTMLPTLEQIGTQYGQYYAGHYPGVKLGVIYRNSSNWQPGLDAFNNYLKQAGQYGNVVDEEPVTNNQGDYSTQIAQMHNVHGAQMVFIYENALAAEQFIQQSSSQNWNPQWLMFPFNLTLETLTQAGVDTSRMDGVIPWPSYTCNASGDSRFAAYKSELQKFEAAYRQYDPGANLCGDGGDLLFGTWLAWEQTYDLLYQCGPGCTRNNIAGLIQSGYHATVGANCPVDFRGGDGHHGGGPDDVDKVESVNGAPAWVTTALCVKDLR